MSEESSSISHAQLEWDQEGQPVSTAFGDVYFSRANGLEETRHVFLQHNQLNERWPTLINGEFFTIAETGFGSGLNFLAAWQLWLNIAPKDSQLHFVSVEKFPLSKTDLTRALALWPELDDLAQALIDAYPVFIGTGIHRLNFSLGRVKLTLIINDAALGFQQLLATTHPLFAQSCTKVDAWFLDGFAPSKNPHMWSEELFNAIALLSYHQTTAATFSAAAIVKNGLKHAGFDVVKVPGFGRKREMVKGYFARPPQTPEADTFFNRRSFSPYPVPWAINLNPRVNDKRAIIVGGGLAGCSSARALAERGWQVTLLERHPQLANEASGNPQGVLYAKLSHKTEMQAEFNLCGLQYSLRFYQHYWQKAGEQCGVLQLAYDQSEQELHTNLQHKFTDAANLVTQVSAAQASEIAGTTLGYSGLYFPQAGWINPRALCEQLVRHKNIQIITTQAALSIQYNDGLWLIHTEEQKFSAPVAVLANARDVKDFSQTQHLPIKSIRGQITYIAANANSNQLKTLLCGEGYIGPAVQGLHCTGATFNLKDDCSELRASDHQTNLNNLQKLIPELAAQLQETDLNKLDGRVAFRCTLPDYLPAVGPAPKEQELLNDFAPLRKNSRAGIPLPGSYWPGLFINIGHGSRGLAYTPLCAEILAAQINQEIPPATRELINTLNPARFLIRDLIKNKR